MKKNIVFYSVDYKPNPVSDLIECTIHYKLKEAKDHIRALLEDNINCRINRHSRLTDLCNDGENKTIKQYGEF